jgi:hypothetical protein
MQMILKEKLWAYIVHNNPDLLFKLQEEYSVAQYLEEKVSNVMPILIRLLSEEKPQYVIEELCLNAMTEELRPSRFLFVQSVLAEEFDSDHQRLKVEGRLTYEVLNMLDACKAIFDELGLSEENKQDGKIYYAVCKQIGDYLKKINCKEFSAEQMV